MNSWRAAWNKMKMARILFFDFVENVQVKVGYICVVTDHQHEDLWRGHKPLSSLTRNGVYVRLNFSHWCRG